MKGTAGSNKMPHHMCTFMEMLEELLGPQIISKEVWPPISPRFNALEFVPVKFTEVSV
jgi:hypothetical protein